MQKQTVDGGAAAGFTQAFDHHAFEDDAQVCVVHERLGSHGVVARIADAIAGGAQGLLPLGDGPAETIGGRRIRIEEQPLRVGFRNLLTRVGGGRRGDIGEGGGDVGRPGDALQLRLLGDSQGDGPTHVEDAFAFPSGRQYDGHAAQATREQLGIDAQALLLGDVGLVEHDDHRTTELGHLRGEKEIAE